MILFVGGDGTVYAYALDLRLYVIGRCLSEALDAVLLGRKFNGIGLEVAPREP